jgi:hypothetical protein
LRENPVRCPNGLPVKCHSTLFGEGCHRTN